MSFRTRLITFFVVIVMLPILAMGALFYRVIADGQQGKTDAQLTGLARAAGSVYDSALVSDRADARRLAHDKALLGARGPRLRALMAEAGIKRLILSQSGRVLVDAGDRTALAPGVARISSPGAGGTPAQLAVSSFSTTDYISDLQNSGAAIVVSQGTRRLGATGAVPTAQGFPRRATVSVHGVSYREVSVTYPGFGATPVSITVLSRPPAGSVASREWTVLAFMAGALVLAFAFALLSSRALQAQVTRLLQAARRLGSGDFSSPVPMVGRDDFAALAHEFNLMSEQLDRRLQELTAERARLRESVRRIGQTFAANLDRPALMSLALQTAIDATESGWGRVRDGEIIQAGGDGTISAAEAAIAEAEHAALASEEVGRGRQGDVEVLGVALRPRRHGSRAHGVLTVARRGHPYTEDEVELLRSLAGQAALALENIDLHNQVSRQAVTDELTGLANHGRFQELLEAEAEQVRRYHHPLGLIMVDLDDFKAINDTYGHPQGDRVLRAVGEVLQENSREADWPARYGGEELALILPHTDLEGAYAIAERVRVAIEQLTVARADGGEPLRVTASAGVSASTSGDKDALIADADTALYAAKRAGKNRTVRGVQRSVDVVGAE